MIEDSIPIPEPEALPVKSEPIVLPDKLNPVFKTSYERYEWLLKNGCTSVEDRKWFQNYKNSNEYRMIYEE